MSFQEALEVVLAGGRVRRHDWRGYLELQHGAFKMVAPRRKPETLVLYEVLVRATDWELAED